MSCACGKQTQLCGVTKSGQTLCNQRRAQGKIFDMASPLFGFAVLGLAITVWAQQGLPSDKNAPKTASPNSQESTRSAPNSMPRSDRVQADDLGSDVGESSSKDTQIDLSPPEDDAKAHPKSSEAAAQAETEMLGGKSGVSEFHTFDPHKAAKSIEVGDFYFRRKNYRAAEDRYREALRYKENDAVATIRLAVCLEKLGVLDDARSEYESYLKILPHGPESEQAEKAVERLKAQASTTKAQ
jgi:tetratricopeptide (TPR) repeat protein